MRWLFRALVAPFLCCDASQVVSWVLVAWPAVPRRTVGGHPITRLGPRSLALPFSRRLLARGVRRFPYTLRNKYHAGGKIDIAWDGSCPA